MAALRDTSKNLFERYQPYRRRAEIGFWIVVMSLQAVFNTVVALIDARHATPGLPTWQPVTWELSSHLALLALVPAVVAFERRFPLDLAGVRRNWAWHVAASVVFSLVHVVLMVALRQLAYAAAGSSYDFGGWPASWFYEYLKDVRTYALVLVALLSYRLFMLRLQGEARVLDAPEDAAAAVAAPQQETAPRPDRFLVRKLRREFLIAASDIDWLQAQGNYVGLRVNGHDYLLRATLTDFLAQLDPARFARVHRSYAANLDRVAEIEPLDGGDARLHMRDGTQIPCSRRYRDALRQ
ncbi:MAG: LytTR family DNA-binding domain-containing protein [Variovorax sp.]